jgi:D-xylose transport system substrate-binding protein
VNGEPMDSNEKKQVPSVLLTPIWMTPANIASTVVKDGFVDASKLCVSGLEKQCVAAGITK